MRKMIFMLSAIAFCAATASASTAAGGHGDHDVSPAMYANILTTHAKPAAAKRRTSTAHARPSAASSSSAPAHVAPHWGYHGADGPAAWHALSTDYKACGTGRMQSPIDLGTVNARGTVSVGIDYKPGALAILNNGHTIQANLDAGSSMVSAGRRFELLQVHFHTPSEHRISGKVYPLVAHFVHRSADGKLAVLGVFFELGAPNPELAKLIAVAPRQVQPATEVAGTTFNPAALLPANLTVYRYMGSLTTPPCSEGVNWHIAEKPVQASAEQITLLGNLMGYNARPVQPLNNRLLFGAL